MPFVHVHHDNDVWFINDLPDGFTRSGYAYVEISKNEYEDYKYMIAKASRWQEKLYNLVTEDGKRKPFERYYVEGVEQK